MSYKNYRYISTDQRIKLTALHRNGHSVSSISNQLKLHKPTIYRELKMNSRPRGSYDAYYANNISEIRKEHFSKNCKHTSIMISLTKEKLDKQ